MTKVVIRADYARRIQIGVSTEETRYYLNGFAVEPSPAGGVNIIATDGHMLGCFRDDFGTVEGKGSIIVKLTKDELKHCAPKRDFAERWLIVEGTLEQSTCTVILAADRGEAEREAAANNMKLIYSRTVGQHFINGNFPDWRRVLPAFDSCTAGLVLPIDGDLVTRLADMIRSDKQKGSKGEIIPRAELQFYSDGDFKRFSPVLVRADRTDWFGIAMPMDPKKSKTPRQAEYPNWLNASEPAEAAA